MGRKLRRLIFVVFVVSVLISELNPTNFDLVVQLLSHGAFQVLQVCYPATMTGEFSCRPPRFRQLDTDGFSQLDPARAGW
jgi:hypothetical protein